MNPNFVYKIALPDVPLNGDPNQPIDRTAIDEDIGFIHLASAEQVPAIVQQKFHYFREISILKIDYSRIEEATQWELSRSNAPDQTLYPHYYGDLKVGFVRDVLTGRKGAQGDFQSLLDEFVSWSS
ncbi:hypothetical protein K7432_008471 [Basidiobolus ranarum]|uniref:DUF952 domain-containing protein n=1 Tax=Basidiobolus ranarum TaxID=34480 RepID=A0ABR2VYK3_9FUNG